MAVTGGYRASYADTASATNYSFASADIGTAAADRYVVVAIDHGAAASAVSSVTVGGAACSSAVAEAGNNFVAIWITDAPFTTGTTATIAVNNGGAQSWCGISVYAYYGIDPTVVATASSAADPATLDLNTSAGGCAVAIMHGFLNPGPPTVTWTGLTEDFDAAVDGNNGTSAASALTASAETPRAVSANTTASSNFYSCAVSFGPTAASGHPAVKRMGGVQFVHRIGGHGPGKIW